MNDEGKDPASGDVTTALVPNGWRGDDHKLAVEAAQEAGLEGDGVELDLLIRGFSDGMTMDDPGDRAIVVRGRTVLRQDQLRRAMSPMLRYLGVKADQVLFRVHDGEFEVRVASRVADTAPAALENAKLTLQLWFGFGLLGLAIYNLLPGLQFLSAIVWGVGLLLGAWQLRRGLAGGRAMLAARLAMGLGLLAREEKLVLPPSPSSE